ncbi:MAG: leucine-rich repeat domain-containing protein [Bacteroidaceae bacterium]|nr:leucine-rich repeat domain-containing protein [Bacteroidaceae bacterium]
MKHKHLIFVITLLMSMVVAKASAYDAKVDGIYYSFSGDEATVVYLSHAAGINVDAYSGDVIIPESVEYEGVTYKVTSIGNGAFGGCNLNSVVIGDNVVSVGHCAFQYTNLSTLIIGPNVNSIEMDSFIECKGLKSIIVKEGNTIYDSRDNCNALIETDKNKILLGCINTTIPESITLIGGGAFHYCNALTDLYCYATDIPTLEYLAFNNLNLSSVTLHVPEVALDAYRMVSPWNQFNKLVPIEYVDLGLPSGTLWAAFNVGAKRPEQYGEHFAWGEIEPKNSFYLRNYKWYDKSYNRFIKYCSEERWGVVDNRWELQLEDDAAYANCGNNWRMPTLEQLKELCNECIWQRSSVNGAEGYDIISKKNGNSIFLPLPGVFFEDGLQMANENGGYWSRTLSSCWNGNLLFFRTDTFFLYNHGYGKEYGFSIRPVRNIKENVTIVEGNTYMNNETKDIDEICYTRTFSNTEWQALYVPFEMTYADWQADFEVARLNDVHQWDDNDDGTIDRTELEVVKLKSGKTEANTPYLIRAKSTGEKTITLTNTTLYKAEENSFDVSSWNTKFTFTGTYSGISGTEMFTNGYYAMGGGTLHQAASSANDLSPMRWYMTVTDRNGNPKSLGEVKVMVFGDDTDGISPTPALPGEEGEEAVFDLSGRRTDSPTKKGVYIKNGRKMIVR